MKHDYFLATRHAEKLIADYGCVQLPIDPAAIAAKSDIIVRAMPPEHDDFSGALVKQGNTFGILYATNIESQGRQRFNVAHELGHYHLPGHCEAVLASGSHYSKADYRSLDRYEREADYFAAGLLMPSTLCRKHLALDTAVGLCAIEGLAAIADVSLTAAAIQYSRLTENTVAILISSNGVVEFGFASDALRDTIGTTFMQGSRVPPYTATALLEALKKNRHDQQTMWSTWFSNTSDDDVYEEVISLGRYGKKLTVLSLDSEHD